MMEAVNDWLDRVIQSSLDIPHPADADGQKAVQDIKGATTNPANTSNIVPFRVLIKSLEILPSSVSSVCLSVRYSRTFSFYSIDCSHLRLHMKCNLRQHYMIICIKDSTVKHGLVHGIEANLLPIVSFASISAK